MKKIIIAVLCVAALSACNKTTGQWAHKDSGTQTEAYSVKITPVITKVNSTSFESGDAIGVSIVTEDGVYADNSKLTYDGTVFSGDLKWFPVGSLTANLKAYHPYADATPTSFTVQANQTEGTSSSDLVAGKAGNVTPGDHAVVMPFTHKLTRVTFTLSNKSGLEIQAVSLGGAKLTAKLDEDFNATADETASAAAVTAHKIADGSYDVIVPPQKFRPDVSVTVGGKDLKGWLKETDLQPGKQYSITIGVLKDEIKVMLSSQIQDWEEGTEILPEDSIQFEENLEEGWFTYDYVKYEIVKLKDGKWWMARNLHFVPRVIKTIGDSKDNVTAGVYYPVVVLPDEYGGGFSKDQEVIEANGYLYQAEVALGLKAKALEGAQGICPDGWHVPTYQDCLDLTGKMNANTKSSAPYYKDGKCSLKLLNDDGFNMYSFGAFTVQDNTKEKGSIMGAWDGTNTTNEPYKDKIFSGMFCGSSWLKTTYYKDPETQQTTDRITNFQFWGLMPMTNKATVEEYTCNGTGVNYRIACPLRCVRNTDN